MFSLFPSTYVALEEWKEKANSNISICKDLIFNPYFGEEPDISNHPGYGMTMLGPMLLVLILTFPHFWKLEKHNWKKTLPIFLLFSWPQYRSARVIFFGLFKKNPKWRKEKDVYERNISSLGKVIV